PLPLLCQGGESSLPPTFCAKPVCAWALHFNSSAIRISALIESSQERLTMRERTRYAFVVGLAAVMLAAYGFAQQAQRGSPGADWSWYMGDLAGTRYSTLKQIDVNNVSQLAKAWTFQGIGGESTPIVVNG